MLTPQAKANAHLIQGYKVIGPDLKGSYTFELKLVDPLAVIKTSLTAAGINSQKERDVKRQDQTEENAELMGWSQETRQRMDEDRASRDAQWEEHKRKQIGGDDDE